MIEDLKKWLDEPCKEEYVKYLDKDNPDESKRGAYIPIGIIEQTLDELEEWSVFDFKHVIIKAGGHWISDASVQLTIRNGSTVLNRSGAVSFPVSSQDTNMDFAATALSFCIANAAKKLGKKFGRHLNGRLNRGETGVKVATIQINSTASQETIDEEFKQLEKKLSEYDFKEDAAEYLSSTDFKHYVPAKRIVNLKPSKQ